MKTNLFAAPLVGLFTTCFCATQIFAQESRYDKLAKMTRRSPHDSRDLRDTHRDTH